MKHLLDKGHFENPSPALLEEIIAADNHYLITEFLKRHIANDTDILEAIYQKYETQKQMPLQASQQPVQPASALWSHPAAPAVANATVISKFIAYQLSQTESNKEDAEIIENILHKLTEKIGPDAIGTMMELEVKKILKMVSVFNRDPGRQEKVKNTLLSITKHPILCVSILQHYQAKDFPELAQTSFYKEFQENHPDLFVQFGKAFDEAIQSQKSRKPRL